MKTKKKFYSLSFCSNKIKIGSILLYFLQSASLWRNLDFPLSSFFWQKDLQVVIVEQIAANKAPVRYRPNINILLTNSDWPELTVYILPRT